MTWEALKVYKPIAKDELATAKKQIAKIISENLKPFGFNLYGRKLIRLSDDLFHVIHLDTRGSWAGNSTQLKTEIAVVSIYDTGVFIENRELTGSIHLEDLIPGIRNHYQITQEYILFADYISRNIIQNVIPHLDKIKNSKDVLVHDYFKIETPIKHYKNHVDILIFSELGNKIDNNLSALLNYKVNFLRQLSDKKMLGQFESLKRYIDNDDWESVGVILQNNKHEVFKKLKIKEE